MAIESPAIAEEYVELSYGRCRFLAAGAGEPTLLLHGVDYTSGGDRWLRTLNALSRRLRVIAPDFPGWGFGDRLDREYSFGYLVDFVREFQDALGIDHSHIVGHSMGGWIASLFAYESPHRVDKLVLVASGGTSTRTLPQMTEFTPPSREDLERFFRTTHRTDDVETARLVDEALKKTEVPGALQSYRKILAHMNDPINRRHYNTLRRLPFITAPTLIVWGANDAVNSVEMGQEIHRRISGSQFVVLENCGHFVPTECPEEFNRLLLEFL